MANTTRCALLQLALIAGAIAIATAASTSFKPVKYPTITILGRPGQENQAPSLVDERVESRLVSSSGDPNLDQDEYEYMRQRPLLSQAEEESVQSYLRSHGARESGSIENFKLVPIMGAQDLARQAPSFVYGLNPNDNAALRNHQALVDDFKQGWSQVANPIRESRAFRPRLMSTARGFGKRAYYPLSIRGLTSEGSRLFQES